MQKAVNINKGRKGMNGEHLLWETNVVGNFTQV